MRRATALLAAIGLPPLAPGLGADESALPPDVFWSTVTAVQEHVWPATGEAPAIADFNATPYLAAVLLDPGVAADERQFLSDGVTPLDAFARERLKRPFYEADTQARETLLRKIETSPVGRYWLSLIVYYVFEALLADPAYGGNPDGLGWRWLAHAPGFPRPPSPYPYRENGHA